MVLLSVFPGFSAGTNLLKGVKADPALIRPAPVPIDGFVPAGSGPDLGVSREMWIGLRNDGQAGDGTLASPFNGSGTNFDAKLRQLSLAGVSNIVIHILPGTYVTEGTRVVQLRNGWRLLGAGMGITTVRLTNSPGSYEAALGNWPDQSDIEVADLTVDCANVGTHVTYASAVVLAGSGHTIRRVRAINASGLFPVRECFILAIFGPQGPSVDNLIEYCEIAQFKGSYAMGISFGGGSFITTGRDSISRGIIRGNRVYNLHSTTADSYCHAYGVAGSAGVILENNFAFGCDVGFNDDTGELKHIVIRGNHFYGCRSIGILSPGQSLENVTIEGNEIEVDATTAGAGIAIVDSGGLSRVRGLKIRDNTLRSVNGLASFGGGISVELQRGESVTISGNRIQAGLRSSLIGAGMLLFDNTDMDGRPIALREFSSADLVNLPTGERGTLLLNKGNAYIFAETGSNPATNGLNLIAAYARARTMTPHGQPLSSANRVTLFLWPAVYVVPDGALVMDAPFVDLVGVGTAAATRIESQGNALVQTANDVTIQNVTLHCASTTPITFTATDKAAYYPADNLNRAILRNVVVGGANNGLGMRLGITYSGYFENVTCGARGWGGPGHFTGAALHCTAGDYSFGSGGVFTGAATNCQAGIGSFGAGGGGFHGFAKNCSAGGDSFGGSGWMQRCDVNGVVNAAVLTTGRLTDCRIGPAPGNFSALQLGAGATLQNCTVLAAPAGSGFSIDAPVPVRAKLSHCRFNHGTRNVQNDIAQPFNVDDLDVD